MADGVILNAGVGGVTLATDEVSNLHYQRIKIVTNEPDVTTGLDVYVADVAAVAAPVGLISMAVRRDADTSLVNTTGDNAPLLVNSIGALKVEVFDGGESHTVDNAGTFAVQVSGTALTELQTLSGAVAGSEMQVDVVAALPSGSNTIGDVTVSGDALTALQLIDNAISGNEMQVDVVAALPAGSNTIGDVTVSGDALTALQLLDNAISGNEMQVDIVTGTVTANLSATDNAVLDDIAARTSDPVVYVDDTGTLTSGASKGSLLMAAATPTDTAVDANDIGALAMSLDRRLLVDSQIVGTDAALDVSGATVTVTAASLDAIQTAVQLIDNAIAGNEMQVDIIASLPAGGNTIGAVTVTGDALTALQVIDNSVFADDAAFTLTSSSVDMAGAVRDDTLSTLDAIEGDAVPLRVSATGALHVTGGGGGTEYTDDTSTHSSGSTAGNIIMAAATPTDTAVDANDIGALAMSLDRRLYVDAHLTGTDAVALDVSGATVTVTAAALDAIQTAVEVIDNAITGSEMQVDLVSADVTNAGTFVVQVDGTALTELQTLSGAVTGTEMQVDIVGITPDLMLGTDFSAVLGTADLTTTGTLADGVADTQDVLNVRNFNYVYNGTTFDLLREGGQAGSILVDLGSNNDVTVTGTITANAGTGTFTVQEASAMDVSAATVTVTAASLDAIQTAVEVIDNAIAGSEMQVDLVSADVTNTGTFAVQVNGDALTALQVIDNSVFADNAAFTLSSSSVNMAGAIRNDSLSSLDAIEGDAVPLRVSSTGALHVTGGGGGTEYTEDVATPAAIIGTAPLLERDDILGALTPIEGDWVGMRATAEGALWTQDFNSDAILTDLNTLAAAVSTEMQVDIVGALPAGAATIGDVTVSGDALTALQLIDDVVYVDDADWSDGASKHLLVGGLYQSVPQSITDGDVGPFQVDANGRLLVDGSGATQPVSNTGLTELAAAINASQLDINIASDSVGIGGGTQYTEDVVAAADPIGNAQILVREDTPSSIAIDGDNVARRGTAYGAAYTQIVDSSGNFIDTFGSTGGTSAADDADFVAGTTLGTLVQGVYESSPTSVTDGDMGAVGITATRALRVDGSGVTQPVSGTVLDNIQTAVDTVAAAVSTEMQVDIVGITPDLMLGTDFSAVLGTADLTTTGTLADAVANTQDVLNVRNFNYVYNGVSFDFVQEGGEAGSILVDLGTNNDVTVSGTVTADAGTGTFTVQEAAAMDVSAATVTVTAASLDAIQTAVEVIDNAISGNEMQVDIVGALPAGAATIGDVTVSGDALTALQLLDDVVYVDDADWSDGTSKHLLVGGLYQSVPQSITDGDVGPLQVTANGKLLASTSPNNLISTSNSTTATLGISAAFTGTGEDVSKYSAVTIQTDSSHDSATDGMLFQFSPDNTNWDSVYTFTYTAADGVRRFQLPVMAQYFRVFYTNGGTEQTHFRLQTIFHTQSLMVGGHRVSDNVNPDGSALLVKSVLIAQAAGSGDFLPIDATAGGNLKVSLEENAAGNLTVNTTQLAGTAVSVNTGTVDTGTQRITLATDVALPTGGNTIGDVTVSGAALTALQLIDDAVSGAGFNISQLGGASVPIGAGTEAAAIRVTLPTNGTGIVGLAAGSNAIGTLAANSGVDIGDVDILSLPASTNTLEVVGDVAHDIAAAGNPVLIAGRATNSIEGLTQVDAADSSFLTTDLNGVTVTRPHTTLEEIITERVANTDGASTAFANFAAGGSGVHNYITTISIWNSSATDGYVDFENGVSGAIVFTAPAPTLGGSVINLPVPIKFADNTAVAYNVSGALTTVYISVTGFQAQG
jgi:hypothetical protein